MTSESSNEAPDDDVRFLADGVIELSFNGRARALTVVKFRGSDYLPGPHTLRLDAQGAAVFPRLMPERHGAAYDAGVLSWGNATLDRMTCGGLERGSITLISGPSGVGKTTVGAQFMASAAERGQPAAIYTFDERTSTLAQRCANLGIPVSGPIAAGTLRIVAVEALKWSTDEFANLVRRDVERNGTQAVMIDSISGYRLSLSDERLNERLHALCRYLQNVGVTVILINELLEITEFRVTDVGITYIADNVVMLRYIEQRAARGAEIGRIIGILKKRASDFDKTFRRFALLPTGMHIGAPVDHLGGLIGDWHTADDADRSLVV